MKNLQAITAHLTAALALGLLPAMAAEDVYCLTLQDCQEAALDYYGIASTYFYSDDCKGMSGCGELSTETMDVTTKGCFMKSSSTGIKKAFFFLGDGKAMTAEVSPPLQERLYCGSPPTPSPPTPPTPTPPTPTPPTDQSGFNVSLLACVFFSLKMMLKQILTTFYEHILCSPTPNKQSNKQTIEYSTKQTVSIFRIGWMYSC